MPQVHQKGIAHILLLILLIVGIGLGVYLIGQKTNLFPHAASDPISGPIEIPVPSVSPVPSVIIPSPSTTPVPSPSTTPYVQVVSPNGGEVIAKGKTVNITWKGTGIDNFTLYLVNVDFPQNPTWLATTYDASQRSYIWNIESLPGNYKIRVTSYPGDGSSITDDSDNHFTIVDTPVVSPSPSPSPKPIACNPNKFDPQTWKATNIGACYFNRLQIVRYTCQNNSRTSIVSCSKR